MNPAQVQHELDAPPWHRFESTLMATSRAIRRAYDARLARIGLNLSEACLLAYVSEKGPVTQTALASRFGMGRASAGLIIDGLIKRGLVEREVDLTDRRVWLVRATEAGGVLVSEIGAIDIKLRGELRAGLSRSDRQQLAQTLIRLQSNIATVLADAPDD